MANSLINLIYLKFSESKNHKKFLLYFLKYKSKQWYEIRANCPSSENFYSTFNTIIQLDQIFELESDWTMGWSSGLSCWHAIGLPKW